jgi:hypothetical protein
MKQMSISARMTEAAVALEQELEGQLPNDTKQN